MKTLGIALVVLGLAGLLYGAIGYDRQTTVLELGGIRATAREHKTSPVLSVVGAIVLVGGIVILARPGPRRD